MAEMRAVSHRDVSPDSVFLSFDSNFRSLFSSASASVDRCSFASDPRDHDSPLSSSDTTTTSATTTTASNQLRGCGGGPDLDRSRESNKIPAVHSNNSSSFFCQKVEKAKVHLEDNNNNNNVLHHYQRLDEEIQGLDSARSSFSLALKECQERRSRSEAFVRKLDRRRPASVDLNNDSSSSSSNTSRVNVVSSSPRLGAMMKNTTTSTRKSGNFPSPGTPSYRVGGALGGNVVNKGWSSERVAAPTNGNKRQVGAALLPLNNNGRALPSKWEDAERWIFSPVAGDSGGGGSGRPSSCQQQQQPLRRPKSKSGPLGAPGVAYYSMYSPALPMYEGGNMARHMGASPFSAGMMMGEGWSFRAGDGGSRGFGNSVEPCIARSMSVHGCTDLVCQTSLTSSEDEKNDDVKDSANSVSRAVSRRDMATQMSPEGSCHSSPRRLSFSPSNPSVLPIVEVQSYCSSKSEVRDVQMDERVTVTRWSKKNRGRVPGKASEDVDEWKLKAIEPRSSAWDMSESVKTLSKSRREEAKITAWENLQKAKAEAALRKLEMKLEKKRSSSIDKIMKKLRSAQKKAQEMRTTVLTSQALQVSKTDNNAVSIRRTRQMGSLSGCFTCHAF